MIYLYLCSSNENLGKQILRLFVFHYQFSREKSGEDGNGDLEED